MATPDNPQSAPQQHPPETLHWGISYLREDIQDLRQDMRHEYTKIYTRLDQADNRLNQVNISLTERIERINANLTERIELFNTSLTERIDLVNTSLTERIDSRFNWAIGIMVALTSASTSAIIAAIKL